MAMGNKQKPLSIALLALGLLSLIVALALDFTGSDSVFRGELLVIGAIIFLGGLYLYPTQKHHKQIINFIFLFVLSKTFV